MIRDKIKQAQIIQEKLSELDRSKKQTEIDLEKKRKENEKIFLVPIIKKQEKYTSDKIALREMLESEFKNILSKPLTEEVDIDELLDCFCTIRELGDQEISKEFRELSQPLFDYLYQKEDIERIEKFLIYRSGSFKNKAYFKGVKKKYLDNIDVNDAPKFSDQSKYIMGYADGRKEILEFMMLCGKIDARSRSSEGSDTIVSKRSWDKIIKGAIGEYGALVHYIYADGEFGHIESDREGLMYWHDKGYQDEMSKLNGMEEKDIV